ncbi:hypothetical protein AGLY_007270 [Aphis glycines]|uniref:Uncharacterized protein n=1 Tax=Aphis glycines TaxID=307491 RepID=A0A6G0TPN3_APHGL|nr:hypothetical protein AGLY_007270 [Aphis glycines]
MPPVPVDMKNSPSKSFTQFVEYDKPYRLGVFLKRKIMILNRVMNSAKVSPDNGVICAKNTKLGYIIVESSPLNFNIVVSSTKPMWICLFNAGIQSALCRQRVRLDFSEMIDYNKIKTFTSASIIVTVFDGSTNIYFSFNYCYCVRCLSLSLTTILNCSSEAIENAMTARPPQKVRRCNGFRMPIATNIG